MFSNLNASTPVIVETGIYKKYRPSEIILVCFHTENMIFVFDFCFKLCMLPPHW